MSVDAETSTVDQAAVPATPPARLCIGLPVFNGERFLAETLDSLLAQTFGDFEIVISDNASTDATPEIARVYAERDLRVRYRRNDRNLGASPNFNLVFGQCRSEYFKWVAADDLCAPRFLEACVDALEARPAAVIGFPGTAFVDAESHLLYHFEELLQLPEWSSDPFVRARQALGALLQDGSVSNVIVFGVMRTSALRPIPPLGNYFGADLPLVARVLMAGEVIALPETLSFLRRHEGSSSSYARSPSAADQQAFYDPSVSGRLRLQWQLRKRYIELLRAAAEAPVGAPQRTLIVLAGLAAVARRALWRLEFEARSALGTLPPSPRAVSSDGSRLHWTELA